MTKKERLEKEKKEKMKTIIDRVIEIILIIIIILLLLHTCELHKEGNAKLNNGKTNVIDITCNKKQCSQDILVNCLVNENSSRCMVPNFIGKTKEDLLNWLSKLANVIDVEYKIVNSTEKPGTILDQSVFGITIKELLQNHQKLVITIADNGSLTDCLSDENNSRCLVPNFAGKTKKDVTKWLNKITNYVKVRYVYQSSDEPAGTIIGQSIESGKKVKDIVNNGDTLVITISTGSSSGGGQDQGKDDDPDEGGDEEEITGEFYVDDSNIRWSDQTELKIFVDSLYHIDGKIAPESSNTYKFVLHNKTSYNLKYNISFSETNPYSMNMKYKLKKNNDYVISEYVSYDQLHLSDQLLNSKKNDTFYLEWKWVSSDNDTAAGRAGANYKLKINVEAESIDG